MGKMRSKVVPCSYEATESQFKSREFDSKAQCLDHFGTFFVKAARSTQLEGPRAQLSQPARSTWVCSAPFPLIP